MEMGNSKIVMKDLNLYYGDFHALKGINMEIPANKVTDLPAAENPLA